MYMPRNRRKKLPVRHKVYDFPLGTVFPLNDVIALDLLRLMAGFNDLSYLTEWVDAYFAGSMVKDPAKQNLAAGRWFCQLRFITSVMHEVLKVVNDLKGQKEFAILREQLDENG